jgi:pimeloyl-ACP methyl ester carboxylesterase
MLRSQRDTDYLNAWLAEGYVIVATDYQGLGTPGGHPHLIVKSEACSLLDSVRSAQHAFRQLSNSVVIVGQSQGAHAAISAALLARDYASDIRLKGTVATGVPGFSPLVPNTKAPQIPAPPRTGGGFNAASTVLGLLRYLALDPTFSPGDYISDDAKPILEAATKAAPLQQYPALGFAQPVFIDTGLADVTAFPEGQYNVVMAACYAGSIVEQHYYPGKDHSGTVNASLVDSIPFVKKLLTGQKIDGNCASVKPPPSGN